MKQILVALTLATGYWLLATAPVSAASLQLNPQNQTIAPNQNTQLTLRLIPQGQQIIGTDIVLTYNPNHIHLTQINNLGVFPTMPQHQIDNQNGRAIFSLIHPYGTYQTTPANIATISVQTQNPTNGTNINLDHMPGQTTDTNVVIQGGTDVLSQVQPATLRIRGSQGNRPTNTPPQNPGRPNNPRPTTPSPTRNPQTLGATNTSTQSAINSQLDNSTTPNSPATPSAQENSLNQPNNPSTDNNQPNILGLEDIAAPPTENNSTRNLILAIFTTLTLLTATALYIYRQKLQTK